MTRAQIWLQHLSSLLVGGSGLVYFVMKHLLTSEDPFAVVNHPAQPLVQHLHVLTAPTLTFVLGVLWARHAAPNARRPETPSWRSGMLLMVGLGPMVASGYLLQVSVEEGWRTVFLWTHLATSALWLLGYLTHLARPTLAASRKAKGEPVEDGASHPT